VTIVKFFKNYKFPPCFYIEKVYFWKIDCHICKTSIQQEEIFCLTYFFSASTEVYDYLEKNNYFDALLPTTSAKQAQAHLLAMCGIEFDPNKMFNDLKLE
jgi:hypothetical protein